MTAPESPPYCRHLMTIEAVPGDAMKLSDEPPYALLSRCICGHHIPPGPDGQTMRAIGAHLKDAGLTEEVAGGAAGITAADIKFFAEIICFEALNEETGIVAESAARRAAERIIRAAMPLITAAEHKRLLSVPIANGPVSYTISSYAEPGRDPEDRWNRGYECAMRDVAALLGGAS